MDIQVLLYIITDFGTSILSFWQYPPIPWLTYDTQKAMCKTNLADETISTAFLYQVMLAGGLLLTWHFKLTCDPRSTLCTSASLSPNVGASVRQHIEITLYGWASVVNHPKTLWLITSFKEKKLKKKIIFSVKTFNFFFRVDKQRDSSAESACASLFGEQQHLTPTDKYWTLSSCHVRKVTITERPIYHSVWLIDY